MSATDRRPIAALCDRSARLREQVESHGSLVVAFSGGADSALLLAAAARFLGKDNTVAATAVSPSLPHTELEAAKTFAADIGVRHILAPTSELDRRGYRENGVDRCFHCKAELLSVLAPLAAELGLDAVATGTNSDDAIDPFRPGIRAAALAGAVTPLRDAGLAKTDVRELSRAWGLATADKPAAACLSSRVAYGLRITSPRLRRIERAEESLREALRGAGLPVRDLRVRDHGNVARVEVDREIVAELRRRPQLLDTIRGFDVVEVDPRGFRSGSMNEQLSGGDS
ncbi:ATP-dependent sacrificial sulfur transferase LarE [Nocardioides humi]|uniref:ATP-dependent sacrificial sulfur transferase LarE n=1 Tax=Nocardioides humi TaxID=449461 RepID=A0ABN2ATL3_9ACTN|nr:ATP-dependent sacrificial sulfur transferase LarE [Nocardioides humi]